MADTANVVVRTVFNGFKHTIITAALTSDGSGLTAFPLFNATSSGAFGVTVGGQVFYPGVHVSLWGLDYDVQDMKIQLLWEATANEQITPLGSAPEDFKWRWHGGLPCPPGLVGATGSILITTVNAAPDATFFVKLDVRKGVPQL